MELKIAADILLQIQFLIYTLTISRLSCGCDSRDAVYTVCLHFVLRIIKSQQKDIAIRNQKLIGANCFSVCVSQHRVMMHFVNHIEEIVADRNHAVHVAGLDQLFADVLVLALTVRGRGSHDKARPSGFVQIGVEIGDPEIVGVADFLGFVHAGQTEGQTSGSFCGFGFDLMPVLPTDWSRMDSIPV